MLKKSSKNLNNNYQDQLSLGNKAEDFYNLLLKSVNESIFGINGNWGVGKTFFYKIIKQKLIKSGIKEDQIIEINVWKYDSSEKIIKSFLNAIEIVLVNNGVNIYKEFERYKRALFGLNPTIKTPIIDFTLKNENKTPEEILVEINAIIEVNKIKFYVFIDDLDRLKPDEVFEVIKFLRIIGQFNSFKYIVTYDKDYLIQSLKILNIPFSEKFLDKIIEYEIQLNKLNSEEVFRLLKSYFDTRFLKVSDSGLFDKINDENVYEFFFESFNVYRDIELFIKEFEYSYKRYTNDLNLKTFALLVSLKINYPSVYSLIIRNSSKYFYIKIDTQSVFFKAINTVNLNKDTYSHSILKEEVIELLGNVKNINLCHNLLTNIFSQNTLRTQLIFNNNNFYSYFNISDERIYKNEFEKILLNTDLLKKLAKDKIKSIYFYLFDYVYDFHVRIESNSYNENEEEKDLLIIDLLIKILSTDIDFEEVSLFSKIRIFDTNKNIGLKNLFYRLFEDFVCDYIMNNKLNKNIEFVVNFIDNNDYPKKGFKIRVLYSYYSVHYLHIKEINFNHLRLLKEYSDDLHSVFISVLSNNFQRTIDILLSQKIEKGKTLYGIGVDIQGKKLFDIVFDSDNFKLREFINKSKLNDYTYNNYKDEIEEFELFFQSYINEDKEFIPFEFKKDDLDDLPF